MQERKEGIVTEKNNVSRFFYTGTSSMEVPFSTLFLKLLWKKSDQEASFSLLKKFEEKFTSPPFICTLVQQSLSKSVSHNATARKISNALYFVIIHKSWYIDTKKICLK